MTKLEFVFGSLTMALCVGIGLFAAGLLDRHSPSAHKSQLPAREEQEGGSPHRDEQLARLEARVRELTRRTERAADENDDRDSEAEEHDDENAQLETPEETADRVRKELAVQVENFEREQIDPVWSREAASSLESSLLSIPNMKFEVEGLECRDKLCVGHLNWKGGADAFAEAAKVAEYPYATNCGTGVYFTEPSSNGESGMRASVVFDCSELRSASR